MQEVKVLGWQLVIDREMTIDSYLRYPEKDCDCCYCQNYRETVKFFPTELASLLESLGLNPAKPIEIIEFYKAPDGTHFYAAIFNVIGYIRESPDASKQLTGELVTESLTDTIQIGFGTNVNFPRHFPDNTFQLEFFIYLPWVLADLDE